MVVCMQSHFTSDPRVRFHSIHMFLSYIWWTSRQYEGFGLEACVNSHLDEDTQHRAMSKKAHAHSPQLSRFLGLPQSEPAQFHFDIYFTPINYSYIRINHNENQII